MNFLDSIRIGMANLAANKRRSALTMLGIMIGNASIIVMIGIGKGAQIFVREQLEALGPNVLFVIPGNQDAQRTTIDLPRTLILADAEAIARQVPSAVAVAPEVRARALVTYRARNSHTLTIGTTPSYPDVRSFRLERGRFFTQLDIKRNNQIVILGSDLAQRLFDERDPLGQQVRIKNLSFTVVGILESKGSVLGTNYDDIALVPITTMSNRIVGRTSPHGLELTFISVQAESDDSMAAAQFQIENLLRLRHKITREDDFTVQSQVDLLETLGTIVSALTLFLAAIAGISLLVGGIGVMNIMLVSVSERTQEIGLRKAVGATQKDILMQFIIEAVILSSLGGLLGTSVGMGGIFIASVSTPFEGQISVMAIALGAGVSTGIGLFFGVYPARQAAKLDPIVALHSA